MLSDIVKGKRVLFVSTKNVDYIRNVQELNMLKAYASEVDVIAFPYDSYVHRILYVYIGILKRLLSLNKYDVIFIGFAPQLVFWAFPFFKTDRLIIDFFISMFDTMVDDRRCITGNSMISKFLHHIDAYVLKRCKHVIVDTLADKCYFSNEFGINKSKMEVLYIEPDLSIYNPLLYSKVKRQPEFTVLYFGSVLPLQGVETVLKTINLMSEIKDVKFVFIGPVNKCIQVNKDNFKNTIFYDWLPQERLAEEIFKADLCLAGHFNKDIGKANRTIAGKTFIYKSMNKPVILGDSEANRELFTEDNQMNFYVNMGDPFELKKKILLAKEVIYNGNGQCDNTCI